MPQILFLAIMVLNLVIAVLKHGEERTKYNAYTTTLDVTLLASILYWGGFFG
tara:strand:+ start:578 stop:733 length:156 start_codon:yes stop_codon:yes gene_type:complete